MSVCVFRIEKYWCDQGPQKVTMGPTVFRQCSQSTPSVMLLTMKALPSIFKGKPICYRQPNPFHWDVSSCNTGYSNDNISILYFNARHFSNWTTFMLKLLSPILLLLNLGSQEIYLTVTSPLTTITQLNWTEMGTFLCASLAHSHEKWCRPREVV